MVRGSYPDGQEHPEQVAEDGLHRQAGLLPYRRRNPAGRANHASYNVAKKVLAFVYQVAIPRSHLRASYGDGFQGAPLRCTGHQEEGAFTRVAGESDEQASSQKSQEVGGADHV